MIQVAPSAGAVLKASERQSHVRWRPTKKNTRVEATKVLRTQLEDAWSQTCETLFGVRTNGRERPAQRKHPAAHHESWNGARGTPRGQLPPCCAFECIRKKENRQFSPRLQLRGTPQR